MNTLFNGRAFAGIVLLCGFTNPEKLIKYAVRKACSFAKTGSLFRLRGGFCPDPMNLMRVMPPEGEYLLYVLRLSLRQP